MKKITTIYGLLFWTLVATLVVVLVVVPTMLDRELKQAQLNVFLHSARDIAKMVSSAHLAKLSTIENTENVTSAENNDDSTAKHKGFARPTALSFLRAQQLNGGAQHIKVGVLRDYPSQSRGDLNLSAFERSSLEAFRSSDIGEKYELVADKTGRAFNYATPIVFQKSCMGCHNRTEGLLNANLAIGDVSGIHTVRIAAPGKGLFGSSEIMLATVLLLIFGLLSLIVLFRLRSENQNHIEHLIHATAESEEQALRLTALINESVDGIIIVDERGTIERVNPAVNSMFGYEAGDLDRKNAAVLMKAEHAETLKQDIEVFLKNGKSRLVGETSQALGRRSDGSVFPLDIAISDLKIGGRQMFTGFIRDATRRKEAELNEKRIRAQFEDAVTSALDGIIIIDEDSTVLEFNPAAEQIFGYQRDAALGQSLSELIVPERYRQAHNDGMKRLLQTGEGPVLDSRIEIEALRSDGIEILIELAIKESEGPNGKIFFGYMRDITEKKAAEEALIDARDRAEVASRAKASFLAMMSHEIRTPLNGVLGVLGLLHNENLNAKQKNLVTTARKSGKSLLNIINDILDFSKLEAGKFELEENFFEVDALLSGIDNLLKIRASEKSILLICEKDEGVPPVLYGDQDRLRQVILNLAWNAIKFTKDGHVSVRVSWVKNAPAPTVRFNIVDTGIGIPKGRQSELFAEFATLDASYSRRFGGTGLGLAICKSLVEAMDGKIGVQSEEGKGSDFWFEVPLAVGRESDLPNEHVDEDDYTADFKSVRVLLAEDNGTNQLVFSQLLEKFGCVVDIVSNGKEAVQSSAAHHYDIILMDVSMPELDGIQATSLIRQSDSPNSKTPIVALTAYALKEDRERVLAAGMDDFVAKPVSRQALITAMKRQLYRNIEVQEPSNPPNTSKSETLFDDEVLISIVGDADDDFRNVIVGEFLSDINRQMSKLMIAVDSKDSQAFEAASHSLKGVAGTFGARELYRLSTVANDMCRAGNATEAFALAETLESVAKNATEGLHSKLASLDLLPNKQEGARA